MKKRTMTIDLEAYSLPCTLGNVPSGFKPNEMMIITAGRQTGKSMYMKMLKSKIYNTNLCNEILLPKFQPKTN